MILHIDMNAFFAMLEVARRPELRDKPVIVGGLGRRGVVAAASYEARIFGVNSAMPMAVALRQCPNGTFLPGDHSFYTEASKRIMQIFYSYTPYLEPLSLDEAFLDVSGVGRSIGSPGEIARRIREEILDQEGLECSIGISEKKHISKIASDQAKPKIINNEIHPGEGILEVSPGREKEFISTLDIEAIWGIGPKTSKALKSYGIRKVGDLAELELQWLKRIVGNASAVKLKALASGEDERRVSTLHVAKSMSAEETFAQDLTDKGEIAGELSKLSDKLGSRLRADNKKAKRITLKLRYSSDFRTITRDFTMSFYTDNSMGISRQARELLEQVELDGPVRLVGLGVSKFSEGLFAEENVFAPENLFDEVNLDETKYFDKWSKVETAIDKIRNRYEKSVVGLAAGFYDKNNRTHQTAPWGPVR